MINNNQNGIATAATSAPILGTLETSIITVFEHQRLTSHDFAQDSDFTWLLTQEFAVFTIKRQRGQWQLKVGHYIGLILLPSGMTLEILPKPVGEQPARQTRNHSDILQTRQWVQRMLSDLMDIGNSKLPSTKNLGQLSDDLVPLTVPALPLSQWLVTQFLQRLSGYQPIKHYQTQVHNQPALQGKLLIKQQLRRNSTQPHKFVCETSQLSQDMLSNRLIKSALLLIESMVQGELSYGQAKPEHSNRTHRSDNQSIKNKSPNNRSYYQNDASSDSNYARAALFAAALSPWRQIAALSHHERRLLDQTYGQAKRQLNTQPLPQQQLRSAQQLLDLAYWLLQQSSLDTGSGLNTQTLPRPAITPPRLCLLIDMNQAFEQWASQRIAGTFKQVNSIYQALYQPQRLWLSDTTGQACLSIRPDLLIYHANIHISVDSSMESSVDRSLTDSVRTHDRVYSHVIDIKWKHLSHAGAISSSDAYQLTSYAQAYQAQQVWLVYPVIDNTRQPIALSQHAGLGNHKHGSSYAKLWLMPFNVLTGKLNGWPNQNSASDLGSSLDINSISE